MFWCTAKQKRGQLGRCMNQGTNQTHSFLNSTCQDCKIRLSNAKTKPHPSTAALLRPCLLLPCYMCLSYAPQPGWRRIPRQSKYFGNVRASDPVPHCASKVWYNTVDCSSCRLLAGKRSCTSLCLKSMVQHGRLLLLSTALIATNCSSGRRVFCSTAALTDGRVLFCSTAQNFGPSSL